MKKYKAVIYDIDGTLLNTLNMNMYPLMRILKEETGKDWSFEEVLKFASYPGMKVMEELHIKDKEKTYARWVRYVNEYPGGASVYEGVKEVLEMFYQAGIKQAVVSAKTREQYEIDVVSKGIPKDMSTAVLAGDTKKHKPDPEPLLECIRRLGIAPEEAIYIGDAPSDYQAAKNAGMDFGYAKWGSVLDMGSARPEWVFERPEEMGKMVGE